MSPPVDLDWHLVTAPADSDLPPALRQGSDAPPQRGPKRTRMLASFHAQTREPDGASDLSPAYGHHTDGDANEPAESPLTSATLTSSCMLSHASMHGHDASDAGSCGGAPHRGTASAHTAPVTPPRLPRNRHARSAGGRPAAPASTPATRIPRASGHTRAARSCTKSGRRSGLAHLPGNHPASAWSTCMRNVLRWLFFAAAAVCAVAAVCLLGFNALRQVHPARPAPAAADVRQLASLLDTLNSHVQADPEGVRAAGASGRDTVFDRRATVAASLEVVSAAEVAQGRLRVALDHVAAPIPASWEKASADLEATLSDLKRTCRHELRQPSVVLVFCGMADADACVSLRTCAAPAIPCSVRLDHSCVFRIGVQRNCRVHGVWHVYHTKPMHV